MNLAGCTPEALACDDTGPEPAWWHAPLELAAAAVLLAVVLLLVVAALRRASRPKRVTTRVWVNANGDVVQRRSVREP